MNILQRYLVPQNKLPRLWFDVVIFFNKVILLLSLDILTKRNHILKDRLVFFICSFLSLNDSPIFDEAVPLVFVSLHHPFYLT